MGDQTGGEPISIDITPVSADPPQAGGGRNIGRWALAAIAAIGLVVMFVLVRQDEQDRAERDAAAAQPTPSPTAAIAPAEPRDIIAAAADDESPETDDPAVEDLEGPLLGETSGWWLFYGGNDQLQRLDLDTGEVDNFGLRAAPVAFGAGELILVTDQGSAGRVSLEDPGEQPQGWLLSRIARIDEPGFLWLYTVDDATWTKQDLRTDMIVERRFAPQQVFPDFRSDFAQLGVPGPDLVTTTSGIYRYEGDQYVRELFGTVLEVDEDRALVDSCDSELTGCSAEWLHINDWSPTGDRRPGERIESAALVGADRWLHVIFKNGDTQLQSTSSEVTYTMDDATVAIAVSPDGGWLAALQRDGGVILSNLDDGEANPAIYPFVHNAGGALLVVEQ